MRMIFSGSNCNYPYFYAFIFFKMPLAKFREPHVALKTTIILKLQQKADGGPKCASL